MTLILSRKPRQDIRIGPDTRVRILAVSGEEVLLGIEARTGTRVLRQELTESVIKDDLPDSEGSTPDSPVRSGSEIA
ncbi:MAG: carbon storage regulator [Gammaproteobacteria bacterium]|nr:MAG: carbon storage regulator [Gammaproteobacteria bacterium]